MKKIVLFFLMIGTLFALTADQKLDLILEKLGNIDTKVNKVNDKVNKLDKRVDKLEEKVNKTEKAQKEIAKRQKVISKNVKEVKEKSCNNIKVVDFDYKKITMGLDEGFKLTFKLKNNYKKTIKNVNIIINFRDSDDNNLLTETLIKDNLNIKPNGTEEVTDFYNSTIMENSLANEYLPKTPKKDIHLEVKPLFIKFKDGSVVRCSRW